MLSIVAAPGKTERKAWRGPSHGCSGSIIMHITMWTGAYRGCASLPMPYQQSHCYKNFSHQWDKWHTWEASKHLTDSKTACGEGDKLAKKRGVNKRIRKCLFWAHKFTEGHGKQRSPSELLGRASILQQVGSFEQVLTLVKLKINSQRCAHVWIMNAGPFCHSTTCVLPNATDHNGSNCSINAVSNLACHAALKQYQVQLINLQIEDLVESICDCERGRVPIPPIWCNGILVERIDNTPMFKCHMQKRLEHITHCQPCSAKKTHTIVTRTMVISQQIDGKNWRGNELVCSNW